jgi:hypothetical protein
MISSQMNIVNPRTLAIITLGAMVNRVSPELYLEDLLDRQADSLMAELEESVFSGADGFERLAGQVLQ